MNSLQIFVLALAAIFVLLLPFSSRIALKYGRFTLLLLVGTVMLMPFGWLVCSAFKTTDAMSQYSFLPPLSEISAKTINLGNFRTLLAPQSTVQGPVTFWRYVTNSLFLASALTIISLFFSSLGGYALAKHRFAGRNLFMIYMLASMTIPGVVLLAPNFAVIWRLGCFWHFPIPPGDAGGSQRADRGRPDRRMQRVPDLSAVDHASGQADERGFLPHQLHGDLERVFGTQYLPADSKQVDVAGGFEPIHGYLRAAIWGVSGRYAASHDPTGDPLLFASKGVHFRSYQRGCKAINCCTCANLDERFYFP
jgi:hypothetical protein